MIKTIRNILLVLLALAAVACTSKVDELTELPQPVAWLNRPADFPVPNFKSKITVMAFYTEDCSGCLKIQPTLSSLKEKYKDDIQIIGVYTPLTNQTESIKEVQAFLKKHKIDYPIVLDKQRKVLLKFHVTSWPTVYIADKQGKIVSKLHRVQTIIMQAPTATALANQK